jgi:protein TonB
MPSLKNPKADLRKFYYRSFEISLIISLAAIIVAFKFSPQLSKTELLSERIQEIIKIDEIINTVQKPDIPPPPKVPDPIDLASNEDLMEIDFNETVWNENDNIAPPPPPPSAKIPDEIPIFVWSEVMPEPIGGLAAIQQKVTYTEIAKRIGLEGKVIIEAVIDENGNVIDAKVLKGLGGGLDEESLHAVQTTRFSPGLQRGKPIRVRINIPVKFVLR